MSFIRTSEIVHLTRYWT